MRGWIGGKKGERARVGGKKTVGNEQLAWQLLGSCLAVLGKRKQSLNRISVPNRISTIGVRSSQLGSGSSAFFVQKQFSLAKFLRRAQSQTICGRFV